MGFLLLAAMIGIPIIEIAVFIQAGSLIGLWPTLAVVVLTAVVGTALLRIQGFAVINRVQNTLAAGQVPVAEVFDGLCLLVAGALLLTPGFVTDGVGLLLFVPPFRAVLRTWAGRHLVAKGNVRVWSTGQPPAGGTVIDGEAEDVSTPSGDEPRVTRDPPRTGPREPGPDRE